MFEIDDVILKEKSIKIGDGEITSKILVWRENHGKYYRVHFPHIEHGGIDDYFFRDFYQEEDAEEFYNSLP